MMTMRGRVPLAVPATIVGAVVVGAGNPAGLWWLAMIVGVAIGLLLRGAAAALSASALAGVLGWGLPLAWQALSFPVTPTAGVVAGIMGLGAGNSTAVIIATLLLAALLGLSGGWLGIALRRLVAPAPAPPTAASPPPTATKTTRRT